MQLSDIPDDHDWRNSSFGPTAQYMKETAFHTWGFLIYRCASYSNEDKWQAFLEHLKRNVHEDLVYNGSDRLLEQYAQWTVVEDKDLEGVSKEHVRSRFVSWRNQHSVFRANPSFSLHSKASLRLPRFTYCLYVDDRCIATLKPHLDAIARDRSKGWTPIAPALTIAIIDGDFDNSNTDFPRSVSRQRPGYPGWAYYNSRYLASFYECAHDEPLCERVYMYPPRIGPDGGETIVESD